MTNKKRNGENEIAPPLNKVLGARKAKPTPTRKETKSNGNRKLKKEAKPSEPSQVVNQDETSIDTEAKDPTTNMDMATTIHEYMAVLSHDFGIEFGRVGEISVPQLEIDANSNYVPGKPLFVRLPRLDELKALHRAIEYSCPSTLQIADQLPLRVVFLEDTLVKGEKNGVRLKFLKDGRPCLFVTPALCERGVPTELERRQQDHHESWQVSIMRELAWKSAAEALMFPLAPDDYSNLGWLPIMTEEYSGLYGLRTKTGELYAPYEDGFASGQEWARCDQNGILLNREGEPAMDLQEVAFFSNKEMAECAEVKPCGELFFSAEEEVVDALRCYRQSAEWRIHLELYCPELYRAVRSLEQQLGNESSAAL
ncbi:MAG: hypothetical protein K2X81_06715 [Candidatus Obscuribacterales bacterium]|nr:hypothetical protein [Candidatus Obscuribacterales bacterium]